MPLTACECRRVCAARYLKFDPASKERSAVYSKHDVWILSTCPWFGSPPRGTACVGFVFAVQSTWHGPSGQHMLEVEPVGGR